jgi:hypothetical protein
MNESLSSHPAKVKDIHLTPEQLDELEALAATNYTPRECAKYFGKDVRQFLAAYEDEFHPIRKRYDEGLFRCRAEILIAQANSARTGNITSAQVYLKAMDDKHFETQRERLINGEL